MNRAAPGCRANRVPSARASPRAAGQISATVPGGLSRRLAGTSHVAAALSAKGITPGSPQFFQFQNAAKWAMDEIDPLNLARYADRWTRTYVDPVTGQSQNTLTLFPERKACRSASSPWAHWRGFCRLSGYTDAGS